MMLKGNDIIGWVKILRRTMRADRRTYVCKRQPVTWIRVSGIVRPSIAQPIFIVGAPRSGTTFLGQCLAALPKISYHFEPVAIKFAARFVYEGIWPQKRAERFYEFVYCLLLRLHGDGHLRLAEKTPQNSFVIPFLSNAFPDSQFIHILRDGRDVAFSYSQKPWLRADAHNTGNLEPGGYRFGPSPRFWVEPDRREEFKQTTDIHRCIWAWRRHVEAVFQASQGLCSRRFLQIRYEEMASAPETVANTLLDFVQIAEPESRDIFRAMMKNVDPNRSGRFRTGLTDNDLHQIEAEAGHLLERLGYFDSERFVCPT